MIFLDIDGVLCTQNLWKPEKLAEDGYSEFNQNCIKNLNKLIEQTNAKVILTSIRRINKTIDEFAAIMQRRGFTGEIIGKVNDNTEISSISRSEEIKEWFDKHGLPEIYVIIDDDVRLAAIGEPYIQHWVRTSYYRGFDEEAFEQALKICKVE